uniref:Polysaccharide pyruvyl transferase domain-containing protein n=1 Tax=viral metagenome TaxID=1070528 RepID=A0A6C0JL99_9ZZZZ
MDAYLVCHNGLGDNIYMVGALNFIKQFYKNVFFLCKEKHYENVKLLFDESSNIICLPFNEVNEYHTVYNILIHKYNDNNDIFVCGGCHTQYLKSKITNKDFLNYKIIDKEYTLNYGPINNKNYSFIIDFYRDAKLNLTYFYEYFDLPNNDVSKQLYESVKHYYLIFVQCITSDNKTLNISNLINKYKNDDKVLLICNDKNLYDKNDTQYVLAEQFVMNKIVYYVDVIKNSDEIYMIDSSFTGIVLPFIKTNRLKAKNVQIILRDEVHNRII